MNPTDSDRKQAGSTRILIVKNKGLLEPKTTFGHHLALHRHKLLGGALPCAMASCRKTLALRVQTAHEAVAFEVRLDDVQGGINLLLEQSQRDIGLCNIQSVLDVTPDGGDGDRRGHLRKFQRASQLILLRPLVGESDTARSELQGALAVWWRCRVPDG